MSPIAAVAGALALVLALSGCVPWFLPQQTPTTSAPTGEKVDRALEPFYDQVLRWKDCGEGLQCTTATAPLDWSDPEAGDIDLALVRHPATGGNRVGSLLVNPGGPGGSGYDFIKDSLDYAVDKDLQAGFDIVGFDPRGVGRSSAVTCYQPADMDEYLYGLTTAKRGTDAWIKELETSALDFGEACTENTGALLEHVDTESAARDLDLLRAVLGDEKLNYLGYSYGTFLGATYAELFPEKVGRLALDGALDPSTSNFDVTRTQAQGFESALRAYLADCLAGSECPFTGTVDEAMATIAALLASVDASPIQASDGRELGSNALLTAIIYPLYQADRVDVPERTCSRACWRVTPNTPSSSPTSYNGRNKDGNYADNSTEAFTSINCLDYPLQRRPGHDARPGRRDRGRGPDHRQIHDLRRHRLRQLAVQIRGGAPRDSCRRRRADPGHRHDQRPGDAVRLGGEPRRAARQRSPPHLRGGGPHRVQQVQRLRERPRR